MNVHKLTAIGAVVMLILLAKVSFSIPIHRGLLVGVIFPAGLSVIALFATGALMSIKYTVSGTVRSIHHLSPYIMAAASVTMVSMLLVPKS